LLDPASRDDYFPASRDGRLVWKRWVAELGWRFLVCQDLEFPI
jgi:hypothetical protein